MKFLECLKSELDLESEAPIDTSNEYGNWGGTLLMGLTKIKVRLQLTFQQTPII